MKLWPSSSGVRILLIVAGSVLAGVIIAGGLQLSGSDKTLYATVHRGTFPVTLAEAGFLKAAESLTYRSLLIGRETEIISRRKACKCAPATWSCAWTTRK
jgi:hypothetical protein